MKPYARLMNIVLSGGGVKGIAFLGAFDVLGKKALLPANLAGVSAGAIAAALAGAGYTADEMWRKLEELDLKKPDGMTVGRKVPAVAYLAALSWRGRFRPEDYVKAFLYEYSLRWNIPLPGSDDRKGLLQGILDLCKDGCLFDGDLLEEWMATALKKKGIRTFADLRGGKPDDSNPSGYRVRMTGVDCNRLKIVTLPDDAAFYGIDPDAMEVAKAVRISTSVPFAFKPVVLSRTEGGETTRYHLVDGGVLDSFPAWLHGNGGLPTAGFRLVSSEKKILSLKTPLAIFKSLISAVHDIGQPETSASGLSYLGEIDTGDVGFLDLSLSADRKQQLFEAGKKAAIAMFS